MLGTFQKDFSKRQPPKFFLVAALGPQPILVTALGPPFEQVVRNFTFGKLLLVKLSLGMLPLGKNLFRSVYYHLF